MKQLVEFLENDESEYVLKFQAFDEKAIYLIRHELKVHKPKYTYIDTDSVHGEIVGSYDEVMTSLETLESEGWEW
jgi:hypothetical protein